MNGLVKFAAGVVAAVALNSGAAQAATWVLDYTANNAGDTPFSATLDLTTTNVLNAAGGYDVTGISGFVDSDAVAGLIDNPSKPSASYSADGLFIFDNVLWTSGAAPVLSNPGLLFTGASGHEYNLFSDDMTHYEMYQATPGYTEHSYGTISLTETFPERQGFGLQGGGAVPEPAAWTLMILGFGGIGATLRRRRARPAALAA